MKKHFRIFPLALAACILLSVAGCTPDKTETDSVSSPPPLKVDTQNEGQQRGPMPPADKNIKIDPAKDGSNYTIQ